MNNSMRGLELVYRPKVWKDLAGHEGVVTDLQSVVQNCEKKLPSAIAFFGMSGRGKTTLSRMVNRYLNCEKLTGCGKCDSCKESDKGRGDLHPDYEEYNGSEIGIDDVRNIIEKARFAPSYRFRIILIDEIHELPAKATSALLKSLEEPPANTLWIIATNLPDKISNKQAIVGRCMVCHLREPTADQIQNRLEAICKKEKVKIPEKALRVVAENTNGQVRDAIKALELVINRSDELKRKDVIKAAKEIVAFSLGEDPVLDEVASKMLFGIYSQNPSDVMSFYQTKDLVQLSNKLLYQHQFIMSKALDKNVKLWSTNTSRDLLNKCLSDKEAKASIRDTAFMAEIIGFLVRLRVTLVEGIVAPEHRMLTLVDLACRGD